MDPATLEGLIVRELRKASEISRRDLAVRLDVARSTAGRRVDSLIERGLIREKGIEEKSGVGRPKRFLELCGNHGAFLGFDFDARFLFVALVDFAQKTILEKRIQLPPHPTKNAVLALLREIAEEVSSRSPTPILGYGIGVPGRVRQEERIALGYPYIRDWENVDLASELEIPIERLSIENNTRTIALGEYWLGNPAAIENLVCLSVRTGISTAVISDGRILRGHHETAGEIRGWTVPGIMGKSRAWLEDEATVRRIGKDGETTPDEWAEFVQGCQSRERKELEIIVSHHADAIARLVQLSDPELVIVAGAFNELGEVYLNSLRREVAINLADHYFPAPEIRFAFKGEFSGAHGAAALAAQDYRPEAV
ncbi:MAG: ROK family transcriptional regulator [Verrucomicrobiales bacterium]|nr:ROK family transcriptional regulator [Verrucomicrobiales bacterium]